jgi:hypothetical protein
LRSILIENDVRQTYRIIRFGNALEYLLNFCNFSLYIETYVHFSCPILQDQNLSWGGLIFTHVLIDAIEDDLFHVGFHFTLIFIDIIGIEGREIFAYVSTVRDYIFVLHFAVFGRLQTDQNYS